MIAYLFLVQNLQQLKLDLKLDIAIEKASKRKERSKDSVSTKPVPF